MTRTELLFMTLGPGFSPFVDGWVEIVNPGPDLWQVWKYSYDNRIQRWGLYLVGPDSWAGQSNMTQELEELVNRIGSEDD